MSQAVGAPTPPRPGAPVASLTSLRQQRIVAARAFRRDISRQQPFRRLMTMHARVRLAFFLVAPAIGALLSVQPVATQAPQQQPRTSPGLPSETPEKLEPVTDSFDYVKRDVMIPMRDGVKLHTVIVVPKGAAHAPILLTRTPYERRRADGPRRQRAPRPDSERLRQRHRGDRRRRLHPRGAGRARQVQLGGGLRHEPAAARAAEPDARRPLDRHVGHDRLAGEERPGDQRQGRHPRHLVRRVPAADGARQPASGAEGRRADEPDGRRLDGRRLVPQRRVPPAEHALHLQPGGHARRPT